MEYNLIVKYRISLIIKIKNNNNKLTNSIINNSINVINKI